MCEMFLFHRIHFSSFAFAINFRKEIRHMMLTISLKSLWGEGDDEEKKTKQPDAKSVHDQIPTEKE